MNQDELFMQRALELAARGRGTTSPNPMVGAVVVRDGRVVGEGWHERAGEPHAEVHALRQAGSQARGATIYVTLEPCSHWGRTGPCTEAILQAGIKEVVLAVRDPNPQVAGRGVQRLLDQGIAVKEGVLEAQARQLNEIFFHWITSQTPFCVAKYAMTMDGKIATVSGESKWISSEASRQRVQQLRHELDGILVGVDTVIADNPALTCRLPGGRQPLRVVLDSQGRLPADAHLLTVPDAETLVATTSAGFDKLSGLTRRAHVTIHALPADEHGRVSLPALLALLGQKQIASLLVEGGASVLGSFFAGRLINKLQVYLAPLIVGGKASPGPVGGQGVAQLALAQRFTITDCQPVDTDMLITAYPMSKREEEKPCLQD